MDHYVATTLIEELPMMPGIIDSSNRLPNLPSQLLSFPLSSSHHPEVTTGGPLYNLIYHDIDPTGGLRIILPYLTTTDRLRLSECCTSLVCYRHHLVRVKLVPNPGALSSGVKRWGLVRLLAEQKGGRVKHLCIGHVSMVKVLDELGAWGCCTQVQTLDLSGITLQDEGAACLGRALSRGGFRGVEVLDLSHAEVTDARLAIIARALSRGACPHLTSLCLGRNPLWSGASEMIATALESGYCHGLQTLDLSSTALGVAGLRSITRALEAGTCPDLRRFDVSRCLLSAADGQAIALALRSGNCSRMEDLGLSTNTAMGDEGLVPVMEALEAGSCTHLKRLDVVHGEMTALGGLALARALSRGCSSLQCLNLESSFTDRFGALRVLEAIRQYTCPDLLQLNLAWNKMDQEHGQLLGDALRGGSCPKLEELVLSYNEWLGDSGLERIATALQLGACPHLKVLKLSKVGMGALGAGALARAISSGSLSDLRDVDLDYNQAMGDGAMAGVVKALGSGTCGKLQSFCAWHADLGKDTGQAVLDCLRQASWPYLETLSIGLSTEPECQGWVGELAAALSQGAGPCLKKLQLSCRITVEGFHHLTRSFQCGACPALKELCVVAIVKSNHMDGCCIKNLKGSLEGRATVRIQQVEAEAEGIIKSGGEVPVVMPKVKGKAVVGIVKMTTRLAMLVATSLYRRR